MTTQQLHDALTLLPADLVAAADQRRSGKKRVLRWQQWAAMAACLALILWAGSFSLGRFGAKQATTESAADMEMAMAAPAAPADAPAEMAPAEAADLEEQGTGSSGTALRMSEPPALRIESGSESLTVAAAGYTWVIPQEDGSAMAICADIPAPTDHPERHPRLTAETEAADLYWEAAPVSATARCWNAEDLETVKQVEIRGNVLPFYRGTHIYEITAQWENGTATYVILVNTLR